MTYLSDKSWHTTQTYSLTATSGYGILDFIQEHFREENHVAKGTSSVSGEASKAPKANRACKGSASDETYI